MGPDSVLDRLDRLVSQFERIVDAAGELPSADATEDIARALEKAAEAELDALFTVSDVLLAQDLPAVPDAEAPLPTPDPAGPPPGPDRRHHRGKRRRAERHQAA